MFKWLDSLSSYSEYTLGIITFNIFIYVFLLYGFFSLFFMFDLKYVKTLNELKYTNYLGSLSILIILCFLSLAGIPPLFGFSGKFLLFIYLFSKSNVFYFFLFVLFNFFALFFYIQNTRFLSSANPRVFFNIKNNYVYWNNSLVLFLVQFNAINLLGFSFSEDFLLYFNSMFSYIY